MQTFLGFAGQGSQYYHMGQELYEKVPTFQNWLLKADEMLKSHWGFSLIQKLYDPSKTKKDLMLDLRISHPALFTVQYAAAMVVLEKHSVDSVFGFSLGELVALTVAGMWPFETAFSYVLKQVDWLSSHCEQGQLMVVLESQPIIDKALAAFTDKYDYAINSGAENYTLSMKAADSPFIENALKQKKIFFEKIAVPYAFHSQWIDPIQKMTISQASTIQFLAPKMKLASCIKLKYIREVDVNYLWEIIRQPIALESAFRTFISENDVMIDCSPTAVIKAVGSSFHGLDSPFFHNSWSVMSKFSHNNPKTFENW